MEKRLGREIIGIRVGSEEKRKEILSVMSGRRFFSFMRRVSSSP